jgi:hypothetical protein
MAQTLDVTQVGQWRVGVDRRSKQALLIFEFTDRPPMAFAMAPSEAVKIARALNAIDEPGTPTPLRLS